MANKKAEKISPGDEIYVSSKRRWIRVSRVRYSHDAQPPYQVIVEPERGQKAYFNWDEPVKCRSGGE